jgi:hypothetical protein
MNTRHDDTSTKNGCFDAALLAGFSTLVTGGVILIVISWMSSIDAMVLTT